MLGYDDQFRNFKIEKLKLLDLNMVSLSMQEFEWILQGKILNEV